MCPGYHVICISTFYHKPLTKKYFSVKIYVMNNLQNLTVFVAMKKEKKLVGYHGILFDC